MGKLSSCEASISAITIVSNTPEANGMIPRTAPAALFLAVLTVNSAGLPGSFRPALSGPALQTSSVPSTQDWSEFKYPELGFAVRFPITPKPEHQVIGPPHTQSTQHIYVPDHRTRAYMLS